MNFLLHLLAIISMTLPNALGYNLVFGRGKILHFGPIGVSLIAAYATFVALRFTGNYPFAVCAGFTGALLAASLFAWLSLRLEGDALGILTIAVHLALLTVILNWTTVTGGTLGITAIPFMPLLRTPVRFTMAVSTIAILWIAVFWLIDRGPFGRKIAALAEHEWYAQALGTSRRHVHVSAFLLSGLATASVNVFYPQYIHLLHPSDYTFPSLIFLVMVVVAGKPGSVPGVVLSTVLLTFLKEAIRFVPLPLGMLGPLRLLLFGSILLLAVWLRRDTLFPKPRTI